MICKVYEKDFDFLPWKFIHCPSGMETDPEVMRRLLEYVYKELKMRSLDDWYRVSLNQLKALEVDYLIRKGGGLYMVLRRFHPDKEWHEKSFQSSAPR